MSEGLATLNKKLRRLLLADAILTKYFLIQQWTNILVEPKLTLRKSFYTKWNLKSKYTVLLTYMFCYYKLLYCLLFEHTIFAAHYKLNWMEKGSVNSKKEPYFSKKERCIWSFYSSGKRNLAPFIRRQFAHLRPYKMAGSDQATFNKINIWKIVKDDCISIMTCSRDFLLPAESSG